MPVSTVDRTHLSGTSSALINVVDSDGSWITNYSGVKNSLKYFYDKTGVVPYLDILPNGTISSQDELNSLAKIKYDEVFGDNGDGLVLMFCDDGYGGANISYSVGANAAFMFYGIGGLIIFCLIAFIIIVGVGILKVFCTFMLMSSNIANNVNFNPSGNYMITSKTINDITITIGMNGNNGYIFSYLPHDADKMINISNKESYDLIDNYRIYYTDEEIYYYHGYYKNLLFIPTNNENTAGYLIYTFSSSPIDLNGAISINGTTINWQPVGTTQMTLTHDMCNLLNSI